MRHNIILAADQQYIPHMATAIRSLVENNRGLSFAVHIINSDIDGDQWRRLEATVQGFDCRLVDAKVDPVRLNQLVLSHHFTAANYYRLLAAELVPAPMALYLDADLIVVASLSDLLAGSNDGYPVAAVTDPGVVPHPDLGMAPNSAYFNSGVMRLDLDRWRQLDLGEKVIRFVTDRPTAIRFVDQCGLNGVINGAWTRLDPAYNVQTAFWSLAREQASCRYGPGEVAEAMASPRIVHYSGSSKPWHLNDRHPLKALYWHYRQHTPFASLLSDDFGPRALARRILPAGLVRALRGR